MVPMSGVTAPVFASGSAAGMVSFFAASTVVSDEDSAEDSVTGEVSFSGETSRAFSVTERADSWTGSVAPAALIIGSEFDAETGLKSSPFRPAKMSSIWEAAERMFSCPFWTLKSIVSTMAVSVPGGSCWEGAGEDEIAPAIPSPLRSIRGSKASTSNCCRLST